jgi:methyl-accepting chemotaxis protein
VTRLSFRTKLWIPLIVSMICLTMVAAFGAYQAMQGRLLERKHALENAVDVAMSLTTAYAKRVQNGELSEASARADALAKLRVLRFGAYGYIAVVDSHSRGVMNPFKPETEGKFLGDYKDAGGNYVYRLMTAVAVGPGAGFVDYMTRKPGQPGDVEKLSFVKVYKPWDWVFVAGDYVDDIHAVFVHMLLQLALVLVVVGIALASIVILINRSLFRSLGGSPEYAAEIVAVTASGDLSHPIATQPGDESSLVFTIKEMQTRLRTTVGSIANATEAIVAATQEIASGNQDLSKRTESQAASLEETAASMEQLTSVVKQNAENAGQASGLAAEATAVAGRGRTVVSEVVATMSDIGQSSEKIGAILGIIESIAFQTNILALNAAVEAARAGEQGRGFAVVASEVRSLAQRSSTASKEIKELIVHSAERVGAGTRLVGQAGTTMDEILGAVRRVTDILENVAAASVEQSDGIEQVNLAVVHMDEVTQHNAALVEEAAAAAGSMLDQTAALSAAVSIFKVSRD